MPNVIEITLRHWCSHVNLMHIFRTHFSKEHLWVAASALSKYLLKTSKNVSYALITISPLKNTSIKKQVKKKIKY